ncbi:MAG: hypothetical protein J6U54_12595 [Clostridiales bacterium]|nr:hypothetical protein [Clostridiales bacterium]
MRTYTELIKLKTFEERFEYLRLNGKVGEETFGFDRYLNQMLYHSLEWQEAKRKIIMRDEGRDLALEGYEIHGRILVHHMNPIRKEDILNRSSIVLNPEYLICTCKLTHDAIHYGDIKLASRNNLIERRPNDTCPWRH